MRTPQLESQKTQAIVAAIYLIIMAVSAGFAFGFAHPTLVSDSPEATLQNLMNTTFLYYGELLAWVIIFIADLAVAIALFKFFRSTSKQVSFITAAIRIIYTLILGIAIWQLFRIIPLIPWDPGSADMDVAAQVAQYFTAFEHIWSAGLIIFGLHLFGLGYLSLRSKVVPKVLGWLLYIGGAGYTFIHASRQMEVFTPDKINSMENWLSLPMALSEILLAFWLLYFGYRKE